ncbi:DivIVA domain-containing protein [Salinifilum ghardaiensis]
MASALLYLFAALVVGAVVFLLASVVFGRGEQLESLPPGATPTRLPSSEVDGSDVRALRFQQVLRGYKAVEVDWALERVAGELDELRGRVAVLQRQLAAAEEQLHRARGGEPGPAGDPADGRSATAQEAATGTGEVPERAETGAAEASAAELGAAEAGGGAGTAEGSAAAGSGAAGTAEGEHPRPDAGERE